MVEIVPPILVWGSCFPHLGLGFLLSISHPAPPAHTETRNRDNTHTETRTEITHTHRDTQRRTTEITHTQRRTTEITHIENTHRDHTHRDNTHRCADHYLGMQLQLARRLITVGSRWDWVASVGSVCLGNAIADC